MDADTNKKINFFDLGLYQGAVTRMFVKLLTELRTTNYNVYGFEPRRIYYDFCVRELSRRSNEPERFEFFRYFVISFSR